MILQPDVCKCVLEFTDETKAEKLVAVRSKCPDHSLIPDNLLTDVIVEECQRKNFLQGYLFAQIPSLTRTLTREEKDLFHSITGQVAPDTVRVQGKDYKWLFDTNRNLEIELVGFDVKEKADAQNIISTNFSTKKNKIKIL